MKVIRERDVEAYLVRKVKAAGGEVRKVQWIGRRGAPDRLVMLRGVAFIEVKRPGKKPTSAQAREMKRMVANGAEATYVSTFDEVDRVIEFMTH